MDTQDLLSRWLSASRHKDLTVVIAGRIAGVRPDKATYRPVACQVIGPLLAVTFDCAERLTISNPAAITLGTNGELLVKDASEARFSWYHKDRPLRPDNLCEEVYRRLGRMLQFDRTGPGFPTSTATTYDAEEFVKVFQGPSTVRGYG